jgi:lysophospholipase L1-like esterase
MTTRSFVACAAAALATAAMAAASCRAQIAEPEPLSMTAEERARDHEEREQKINARIVEAEARWNTEVARAARPRGTLVATARNGAQSSATLARFHAALAAYERSSRTRRLVILQIGDSHTAGDNWTGYLRERLQRRFGDGGRGMLAPGKPFTDYRPYQIRVAQNGQWGVFNYRQWAGTGITSYALIGNNKDDSIEASMRGLKSFEEIEVEIVRQPDGGSFTLNVDGRDIRTIATRGESRLERVTVPVVGGGYHAILRLNGDGAVAIISWSLLRRSGLVFVSHGVPGETVGLIGKWDTGIASWQVAHLDPALIVVAFGTNDGFVTRFNAAEYEAEFRDKLLAIRSMAPKAAIAVVTAPGGDRLPSWCARNRAQRERVRCRALAPSHAENYADLIESKSRKLCYWHSPPGLEQVRRIQRAIAERMGAWFWDWSEVTGKECGMDRWARLDPPLAIADRVHMRLEGYDLSGEALYRDLLRDYSGARR